MKMEQITEIEAGGIGLLIIIGIAVLGYEAYIHREGLTEVVRAVEATEKVTGVILEPIEEEVNIVTDLVLEGREVAQINYIKYEGGDNAVAWLSLFGSNIYNDGFGSFHFRELAENAEALAKKYGKPSEYFAKVGTAGMTRNGRISPYEIRQNLDNLPFSNNLHGLLGTNATKLKSQIWTDWDKLPEWEEKRKAGTLDEKTKKRIREMKLEDELKLEGMIRNDDYQTWIVQDRVMAWSEIMTM